jgi:hypothetical protein
VHRSEKEVEIRQRLANAKLVIVGNRMCLRRGAVADRTLVFDIRHVRCRAKTEIPAVVNELATEPGSSGSNGAGWPELHPRAAALAPRLPTFFNPLLPVGATFAPCAPERCATAQRGDQRCCFVSRSGGETVGLRWQHWRKKRTLELPGSGSGPVQGILRNQKLPWVL